MHLVQLLLPTTDNEGRALSRELFARVRTELLERFGGITGYTRSPAKGIWLDESAESVDDDLVVYEVVVDQLDRAWWRKYLGALEANFRQERLHVRAMQMELL